MEYLMTYGWTILIIAVVLSVMFQLGVFSKPSLGNGCSSSSGYLCRNASLASNGILTATIGQAGGAVVTATGLGCSNTTAQPPLFYPVSFQLVNGGISGVTFVCPLTSNLIGSRLSGTLWMQYSQGTQVGLVSSLARFNMQVSTVGTSAPLSLQYTANLNGASSYIEIPASGSLSPATATMTAWIKPAAWTGSGEMVLNEGADVVELYMVPSHNLQFAIRDSGSNIRYAPASSLQPSLGTWQYVAVTYDGSNTMYYLNGASDLESLPYGTILSTSQTFCIGCMDYWLHNSGNANFFSGSIADVQLYSKALNSQQIQQVYQGGIGGAPVLNANLIGWWPLDNNANDYSNNGNNGAPTNVMYVSP